MYSISQVVFFLSFLSVMFLLLVFGETTLGIYLLGFLVLLCISSFRKIQWSLAKKYWFPLGAMGVFVLSTFLSLLTSVSLPHSVNAVMFYAASYVVFFTLLCSDPEWLPSELLAIGAGILGSIFAVLTLLYSIFPSLTATLPTVSLLTAQYGHNQAAVLFLLLLPVAWYFANVKKIKISYVAVGVLLVALLASFSRVGVILGFLQLVVLVRQTANSKFRSFGKLMLLLMAVLMFVFVLANHFGKNFTNDCVFPVLQDKLCKSISTELRPAYWLQALKAIQLRPGTGWGGGTFPLLSPLLQERYGEYTGYAHQEFLQAFVEYGVFGGISLTLFFMYIGAHSLSLLQKERGVEGAMALGILSVILTSFFDFGLHMISLWLLFLLGSAVVLSKESTLSSQATLSSGWHKGMLRFIKTIFWLSAGSVLLWTSAFVTSEVLWKRGSTDLSLKVFPFAYWKVEESLQKNGLSGSTNSWLLGFYKNSYRAWDAVANSTNSSSVDKTRALRTSVMLDPLSQYRYLSYVETAIKSKDAQLSEGALSTWLQKKSSGELDTYTYAQHGEVASLAIAEANRLHESGEFLPSLHLLQYAYHIQPEQFASSDIFLFKKLNTMSSEELLPFLNVLQYQHVYQQSKDLYDGQSQMLVQSLLSGNGEVSAELTANILRLGGDFDWQLHRLVAATWKVSKQPSESVLTSFAKTIISWESNSTTGATFDYSVKHDVALQLKEILNLDKLENPAQAQKILDLITQIDKYAVDAR